MPFHVNRLLAVFYSFILLVLSFAISFYAWDNRVLANHAVLIHISSVKKIFFTGKLLSKALTCMKIFFIDKNDHFVKKTDTFGYIVV